MIKKLIFVGVFMVFCFDCFAQDSLKKEQKLFVHFLPLALIDFNPTYMFGVEHRIGKRWSMLEEFGYGADKSSIYRILNGFETKNPYREALKGRIEWRKYSKKNAKTLTDVYWGYDIFLKIANDRLNRTIARDCFTGNCAFFEDVEYPVRKYVGTANIKYGFKSLMSVFSDDSRTYIDFSMGAGVRYINIQHKTNADLSNLWRNGFGWGNNSIEFGSSSSAVVLPNITANLRLTYLLK